MDRARDLPGWPHSDRSRFVRHRPHDWHIQEMGEGPLVLLLHGAGSSTHTWRDMLPLLARNWHVVAIDLPGQGFTRAGSKGRTGLDSMTEDISSLCEAQGWAPVAIIGHSAGAAIALALSRGMAGPPAVIGINAALGHFEGVSSWLFPVLARLLAINPLTAFIFTIGGANAPRARRLIEGTGSSLDDRGYDLYGALIGDREHVDATLQMMTRWNIAPLLDDLPKLRSQVLLIVGDNDKAVPPETSVRAAANLHEAQVEHLPRLGHLAHEEAPDETVNLVEAFLRTVHTDNVQDKEHVGHA